MDGDCVLKFVYDADSETIIAVVLASMKITSYKVQVSRLVR
jgi:hypothetical protein